MITIESLNRKNFKPKDFYDSSTVKARESDKIIGNEIDNLPKSQSVLICLNKTADKLQEIRDKIKVAIILTSVYRCEALNKAVGGSKSSWHMQGLAADINAVGYSPLELVKWIKASNISVDKCFVETGCVHIQFNLNESKNRNFFGYAERINGEWIVKPL